MSICEQCGKEHDGTFGSGRFCCRSCSNKWVALHQSAEAKDRKVEAGKKNLAKGRSILSWNLSATKDEMDARNAKSAKTRTENAENRRREILEDSLITGIYPENYDPKNTSLFKYDLLRFGYKEYICESCNRREWLGKPIPLELHHLDGDRENNKLSNLEFLCPNCHAFTPNYRWKKAKRVGDFTE